MTTDTDMCIGKAERILVIDDDDAVVGAIEMMLQQAGYRCRACHSGSAGLKLLKDQEFDAVVANLNMPGKNGLDVVSSVRRDCPSIVVMLMTSYSSLETAIEAMRRGANDYIIKPFDNDDFLLCLRRALEERQLRRENASLRRSISNAYGRNTLIGQSGEMKRLHALINRIADTGANVLIHGESGTGKEIVAQSIHFSSERAQRPFVPVNCGAIPADLIESELFGRTKGAYTGATASTDGLIREAGNGTLFLDEVSELPLNTQVKLLRVLQERQVRALGSNRSHPVEARFVAACNRNLRELVDQGAFRADLYYRLNVITVHIPPLRDRGSDIDLLANHFIRQYSRKLGSSVRRMNNDFSVALRGYAWPGNVRELQNAIERAVILAETEELTLRELEELIVAPPRQWTGHGTSFQPLSIEEYIKDTILRYQDRVSDARIATMLGIGRKTLWMRRKTWGLSKREPRDLLPN